MSSWKKAAKVNQKTHRERHQPKARESLGILEKKKDYIQRARSFHQNQNIIKKLKNIALNKNPDEFYFHMVNSKLKDGKHVEINSEEKIEHSLAQLKLMENRNYKYVCMKRTAETKKINKIQSELHMIDVAEAFPRHHIYFDNDAGPSSSSQLDNSINTLDAIGKTNLTTLDSYKVHNIQKEKDKAYEELVKRIDRENQLLLVQRKMEIASALDKHKGLPVKCIKKGSKTEPPVFLWKYERKR